MFRHILFEIFALNFECCTKYDAFCSYIFDYACLGRRPKTYCYQKGSKLWKNFIKNMFESGWWGRCIPPRPPPPRGFSLTMPRILAYYLCSFTLIMVCVLWCTIVIIGARAQRSNVLTPETNFYFLAMKINLGNVLFI